MADYDFDHSTDSERTRRVFSVSEANALLPALETRLSGLRQLYQSIQKRHDAMMVLDLIAPERIHRLETQEGRDYAEAAQDLEALVRSFEVQLAEIEALGCFVKDVEKGLVDFYHSLGDGELVFLCWMQGEPKVTHWHSLDGGFSGRQPIRA